MDFTSDRGHSKGVSTKKKPIRRKSLSCLATIWWPILWNLPLAKSAAIWSSTKYMRYEVYVHCSVISLVRGLRQIRDISPSHNMFIFNWDGYNCPVSCVLTLFSKKLTAPFAVSLFKPCALQSFLSVAVITVLFNHCSVCTLQGFLRIWPFGFLLCRGSTLIFTKTLATQDRVAVVSGLSNYLSMARFMILSLLFSAEILPAARQKLQ